MLKEKGYTFDYSFTSVLKRAVRTLYYIQDELDLHWIPVVKHWRLNERHYGGLQGLNKAETAAKYGEDQVKVSKEKTVQHIIVLWVAIKLRGLFHLVFIIGILFLENRHVSMR